MESVKNIEYESIQHSHKSMCTKNKISNIAKQFWKTNYAIHIATCLTVLNDRTQVMSFNFKPIK